MAELLHQASSNFRTWIFDGIPDHVDRNVPSLAGHCKYIMLIELSDGLFRVASSCSPTKFIQSWKSKVRSTNALPIARVLVSIPLVRHAALKRALVSDLTPYRTGDGIFEISAPGLTEIASPIFASDKIFMTAENQHLLLEALCSA